MQDYGAIRNLYKSIDKVNSTNLVVGEWNMNKYQEIYEYGVYKDPIYATTASNLAFNVSSSADPNALTGQNYLIYEDRTVKLDPSQEFFSNLSSVFLPNRPDPGIILMQYYTGNIIAQNSTSIRVDNLSPNIPRYYPFSNNREYDYFNSAKVMGVNANEKGVANAEGKIFCASPFVVYNEEFPINKVTVKLQNHLSVPTSFRVDILVSGSWQSAFSSTASSLFSDGILDIYLSNGTWSTTVSRLNSVTEVASLTSNNIKRIKGLRLVTFSMSKNIPGTYGLELIELSPRLEIDLTSYTESFSFNSSMGDTTSIGLPVGAIVSGTGNISLSNEDNQFLFSSTLNDFKMLNPDTKFTFYQIVDVNGSPQTIPLKVLYSNEWSVAEDYSVSVALEDGFKFLREKSASDLMLQYKSGTKLSTAILTVLDNAGITGLKFEQSSLGPLNSGEDVSIRNFFCRKEQTVAEVLQQLAVATQCSMFYDAEDKLNVYTKEKLVEKSKIEESSSSDLEYNPNPDPTKYVWYKNDWYFYNGIAEALPKEVTWTFDSNYGFSVAAEYPPPSQNKADAGKKTDFWFIFNEDYTNPAGTASALEYPYTASYTANVSSYNEIKLNPITDGEVAYHTYGPPKQPGIQVLPKKVLNDLIEDIPASTLAFSNYTYKTAELWRPGEDNSSVLGAANLSVDLTGKRLKDVFTSSYTALNEEEAIRKIYETTNDSAFFDTPEKKAQAKKSLIIFIDRNEGFTFPDYEGTVFIDKEYIKYRGKLYSINGRLKILFSQEEFTQEIRYLPKGSSISIIGLVVEVLFQAIKQENAQYTYTVIGDGRAKFASEAAQHFALAENSDGIDTSNQFKITLGAPKNYTTPGNLTATTKFNFLDRERYKSAKASLGSIDYNDLQSYLGFLKLSGPKSPASDINIIEKLATEGPSSEVIRALNQMNKAVDEAVPGDFDDYVYMSGERNIYGQVITLPFTPNSISTRMRLFSSQKKRKGNRYVQSTNSSIAGIGFGFNSSNEGYFVEVESIGAGKDSVSRRAAKNNLRLYKIFLNANNVYEPKLLFTAPVGAQTVSNTEVQVLKNTNVADPVFELEIQIEPSRDQKSILYSVYYGNRRVNSFREDTGPAININSRRIFMFVRNDSQAIYEYISAAARPATAGNSGYFKSRDQLNQDIQSGVIPVNNQFIFKDDTVQYYFNDFARLVRQVREYDVRFQMPAYTSALVDISRVNPEYLIKKYSSSSFGANVVVVNTSSGPILLGDDSMLPLFIVGIQLEEISSGLVTMKDYYDLIDKKKLKVTQRERNLSIYGSQTFNLDSEYIQTIAQAKNMMRWITKYCSRQRLKMSLEVFPNPLLELGDKVRIYDKTRGYTLGNENFGDRAFVVSSISYSVNEGGPSMNLELIEVGQ